MKIRSYVGKIVRTGVVVGSLVFAVSYTSVAAAAGGCGHGWHRNYHGKCVPNYYQKHCWRNFWGHVRCN